MKKLRRTDLYFCNLYGLIEELSVKQRLLFETYEHLINLYLSEFEDLSEDQKLWFSRFVGDDSENFYQFLRILKTYKFWKHDDSEYLNRVYHRLEHFNLFLNSHFYESFQDYLDSRFGIS